MRAYFRVRQLESAPVTRRSSQFLQVRDQLSDLVVGEAEVGHLATRFELLRIFEPPREVLRCVVEPPGGQLLTTFQMREIGACARSRDASPDGVAIGARLREEEGPARMRGFVRGILNRPRLPF